MLLFCAPFDEETGRFSFAYNTQLGSRITEVEFNDLLKDVNRIVRRNLTSRAPWFFFFLLLIIVWGFVFPFVNPKSTMAIIGSVLSVVGFVIVLFQQRNQHHRFISAIQAELSRLSAEERFTRRRVRMELLGDENATTLQELYGDVRKLRLAFVFHNPGEEDVDVPGELAVRAYNELLEFDPNDDDVLEILSINPAFQYTLKKEEYPFFVEPEEQEGFAENPMRLGHDAVRMRGQGTFSNIDEASSAEQPRDRLPPLPRLPPPSSLGPYPSLPALTPLTMNSRQPTNPNASLPNPYALPPLELKTIPRQPG